VDRIERSALVPFSCEQMFALVNNIESYPQFMPGCVGAKVMAEGDDWLEAKLELSSMGVKQSFSTRNNLSPPHSMRMSLIDGPFKSLEGEWLFEQLNQSACKVTFWLELEFSNALLALTLPKFFEGVASDQVDALCKRARAIYGNSHE
jgi:ribosome-associated toxin RatA of RatAB toxin-antitoxin module